MQYPIPYLPEMRRLVLGLPVFNDPFPDHGLRKRDIPLRPNPEPANLLTHLLREKRLPPGPVQHGPQDDLRIMTPESPCQRHGLAQLETPEINGPSQIEGCAFFVPDQVVGTGNPENAETQTAEIRVGGPPVVKAANQTEEILSESLVSDVVGFVNEDDHGLRDFPQHNLLNEFPEMMHRREPAVLLPPFIKVKCAEIQVIGNNVNHARVPFLRRDIRAADLCEINHRTGHPVGPEPLHGPHPQTGLAHLPAVQHITKFPGPQPLIKKLVRVPRDIAGRIIGQTPACLVLVFGVIALHGLLSFVMRDS